MPNAMDRFYNKCSPLRFTSIVLILISCIFSVFYLSPLLLVTDSTAIIVELKQQQQSFTAASTTTIHLASIPAGINATLLAQACSVCNPFTHICHRRMSWIELEVLLLAGVASGGTADWIQYISRLEGIQKYYTMSRARMARDYRSVSDAVRHHKFHAPCKASLDSRLICEFNTDSLSDQDRKALVDTHALPSSVCVPNDFPYALDTLITHQVIWSRVALFNDTARIQGLIEQYYPAESYETLYLVNPPSLQTIRDIFHIHVFVRDRNHELQQKQQSEREQHDSHELLTIATPIRPTFEGLILTPLLHSVEKQDQLQQPQQQNELQPFFVAIVKPSAAQHRYEILLPSISSSSASYAYPMQVRLIDLQPSTTMVQYYCSFNTLPAKQQQVKQLQPKDTASSDSSEDLFIDLVEKESTDSSINSNHTFELDANQVATLTAIHLRLESRGSTSTYVFHVKHA